MTDSQRIIIQRAWHSGVTAEGDIDDFAGALPRRAGFIALSILGEGCSSRLPFDIGAARENERPPRPRRCSVPPATESGSTQANLADHHRTTKTAGPPTPPGAKPASGTPHTRGARP